jgi:hypothetical protein
MMKIELEIPEWAIGKPIYVFANQELLAYSLYIIEKLPERKEYYTPLKVKTSRCNGCGDCCKDGSPFGSERGEPCDHLTEHGCGFGPNIPFSCARSDCSKHYPNCTERFE